ncbi:MAG: VOC family protein [Alphaproteobacteria bacterium]
MSIVSLNSTITIAISVKDRHASAEWYNKMLGFELLYHADEAGWSELSTMTEQVTLGLAEQAEPNPGNSVPVFGVADAHKARKDLEAEGVEFDGETMVVEGMVITATFYDPDRNAVMIAQDLTI